MKNKHFFIISLLISTIFLVTVVYFSLNIKIVTNFEECVAAGNPIMESYPRQCHDPISDQTFVENISLGGERDEHGCLNPAGYSWNETLQICLREWEFTDYKRQIIEYVMQLEPTTYGKTVVDLVQGDCPDCFTVWFDTFEKRKSVDVNGRLTYDCSQESRNADFCIDVYEPVCGFFDGSKIQCIKEPCANTYSNSCFACLDKNVLYYSKGECQ